MTARIVMIQDTASSVGRSVLVLSNLSDFSCHENSTCYFSSRVLTLMPMWTTLSIGTLDEAFFRRWSDGKN